MEICSIILSAGKGSRMFSDTPKPLHLISGKPMLEWVIDANKSAKINKCIIVIPEKCNTLEKFYDIPERWLDINWDKDGSAYHVGRVNIVMTNEPGSLASVTNHIYKYGGNISNLQLINREVDFFRFLVDVEVKDLSHITNIIVELRSNIYVETVDRYRG